MIKLFKGFYVHITFFAIFLLSFITGTFYVTAIAFLMALCHELTHLLFALFLKEHCHAIALMPYGLRLFMNKSSSLWHEFLIAASGPSFNALMLLAFPEGILFDTNFAMLLINLFPIMPLDGGRMCYAFLSCVTGSYKAVGIMRRLSLSGGIFLTMAGIFQAVFMGFNLSVLTAGAFLLFSAIGDNSRAKLFLSSLSEDREKPKERPKKAFFLAADKEVFARKLLEYLPAGKYAFVAVLNSDGTFSGLLSEEEIFRNITVDGALVKMGEILQKRG